MLHFILATTVPILETEWKKLNTQASALPRSHTRYGELATEITKLQDVVQYMQELS
jgi:hypothetical protein